MAVKKDAKNFTDAQRKQLEKLVMGRNIAQGKLDDFAAYLADEFGIVGDAGWTIAPDLSGFTKVDVVDDAGV